MGNKSSGKYFSSREDSCALYGWLFEDGRFKGLSLGTKVVVTKSGNRPGIGTVGNVITLTSSGEVGFAWWHRNQNSDLYTSAAKCKSKWGIAVLPSDYSLDHMPLQEAKKYCQLDKKNEVFDKINSKEEIWLGPYGWFYTHWKQPDSYRGLSIGTKVVYTRSEKIGLVGHVVRFDAFYITFEFKNDAQALPIRIRYYHPVAKPMGIAVIPSDYVMTGRMSEKEAKKICRNHRNWALLPFLQNLHYLVNLIRDYENGTQLWFSPLGWLFENGKFLGLQKSTRVVDTNCGFVGFVVDIDESRKSEPFSTVTVVYPIPCYPGCQKLTYSAAHAKDCGICVVPPDTDLYKRMKSGKAQSYIRVQESEWFEERNAYYKSS